VEWQAGIATPDPNSPGNYVRDVSACYRYPAVGGVYVIDDTTFVSPYLLSETDSGQILVVNAVAAFTVKVQNPAPFFESPAQGVWNVTIINIGAPTVTLDRNSLTIDGASANLSIEQFQAITLSTDGTNYYTGLKASGFTGGVVANTGTSVTLGNTHRQKLLTTSNASGIAVTLDSTVSKGFMAWHLNLGAGTATLTPSSGNINGSANLAMTTGQGCALFFDGTNWFAEVGAGSAGGGTGTVTHTGSLTAHAVILGNGSADIKAIGSLGTSGTFLKSAGSSADPAFSAIAESDVTSLVSDLALKAPLASPTFTGTPAAPTAPGGTNTTQIATTAFVEGELASYLTTSSGATKAGVQQESYTYAADSGTANAYAVTLSPVPTLAAGSKVVFKAANANTGASTLAVNGGLAKNIYKKVNQNLVSGDILANQIIELVYDGTNFQLTGNGATGSSPVVIGFVINNGAAGNNVGPMLQPTRAGTISKCAIVTKASDGTTGLTFRIKQNGVDVFSVDPSVAAGTSAGTTSSSTSLTSSPLSVAVSDVFQIDITSGTPNWQFTAQLET
jgi:hypothetical protein